MPRNRLAASTGRLHIKNWASARRLLEGLPGGRGLNIAHEAIDRHAAGVNTGRVAFRWIGRSGESRNITDADLRDLTNRFANLLGRLGVVKGDVVVTLAGRTLSCTSSP